MPVDPTWVRDTHRVAALSGKGPLGWEGASALSQPDLRATGNSAGEVTSRAPSTPCGLKKVLAAAHRDPAGPSTISGGPRSSMVARPGLRTLAIPVETDAPGSYASLGAGRRAEPSVALTNRAPTRGDATLPGDPIALLPLGGPRGPRSHGHRTFSSRATSGALSRT